VGRKGFDYFKTKSWPIAWSITDLAGVLSSGRANELADRLAQAFLSGEVDEIVLLYNSFVSTLVYRPTQEQLLPLSADALSAVPTDTVSVCPQADYLLEPDAAQLLESLLPRSIRSKVYIVLAETFTAEHSARMVAMSGATRNCEELTEALTLRMNKARQASITKEIIEIVSGAEALSG
jgi:F-type H+-transporting ATPase subunit gamma